MSELTQAELRRRLDYDPETGVFTWTESRGSVRKGVIAGAKPRSDGYLLIRVYGNLYLAHRLAWLYMTGTWPENDIDHINCVRDDNRFINLRGATRTQNLRNSKPQKGGTSRFKGVYFDARRCKWVSGIQVNKKQIFLGYFDVEKEAAAAYAKAANDYFENFARVA